MCHGSSVLVKKSRLGQDVPGGFEGDDPEPSDLSRLYDQINF